jgi:hypothetical protein
MHDQSHPSPPSTSARAEHGARLLLQVGSAVAADARAALRAETGLRTAAGVAHSKVLAKLCSGYTNPTIRREYPRRCDALVSSRLLLSWLLSSPSQLHSADAYHTHTICRRPRPFWRRCHRARCLVWGSVPPRSWSSWVSPLWRNCVSCRCQRLLSTHPGRRRRLFARRRGGAT